FVYEIAMDDVIEEIRVRAQYAERYVTPSVQTLVNIEVDQIYNNALSSNFNLTFNLTGIITPKTISAVSIGTKENNNKVYNGQTLVKESGQHTYSADIVSGHTIVVGFETNGANAGVYGT